jgi:RNA polymerase sigma-70 factor (ECF subfamily)
VANEGIPPNEKSKEETRHERFLCQLMPAQKRIYGFIRTMVLTQSDTDDLMQETAMVMWSKFDDSESIADFAAWGIRIARYRILKFREKQHSRRIRFSNEAFEQILERYGTVIENMDDRLKALENCVAKLNEHEGQLIQMRYGQNLSIKKIAERVDRPVHGMYKAMARIHNIIQRCVNHTLAAWKMAQ